MSRKKKLDEELASAAGIGEPGAADDAPAVVKASAPLRSTGGRNKNLGLLAALLVMVTAVVGLFMVAFKEAAIYATPVDQLMESREKLAGRKVRVEGELVAGTLQKRDDPCEYRFRIHGPKSEVPVRYAQCVIPDTFRDVPAGGVQVTVEGALSKAGDFEATLVMAKCSSKYDPSTHKMGDEKKPGALPVN
jgi:cytochrome c-type biogenesis protein CcmE